ncbi:putative protein N(5)-glutamine methyltransferase [Pseudarthrobacter sp. P1]|uniref:putative protein N(5)-glutamine methyltransferase n=1 Tax=Pseudarthrobacter sp. P1 TaxID=3418418 RepID=UPI003CFA4838
MNVSLDLSASGIAAELRAAGCVYAEDEAALLIEAALTPEDLAGMVARRVSGLPLEPILGWAEFAGLRIGVDPDVFVPRRRTEFLVAQALDLARKSPDVPVLLDLCCGSGAVGAALATALAGERGGTTLYAADIHPAAVACARRNLAALGAAVFEGDLFAPLPKSLRGRVTLLLVNAPYVPTGEIRLMPPEARLHEPAVTLDGGPDGLDIQRRVAAAAGRWLAPGGHLLVETSERQAPALAAILAANGLRARVASCGELDATVVVGRLVGAAEAGTAAGSVH